MTSTRRAPRGPAGLLRGLTAVALALTTACGGAATGGAGDSTGPARQGGKLVVPTPGDSRGLDPFVTAYNGPADGGRMSALYDMLLSANPATGEITPQTAESLTPDPTGTVWTLRIRPGITFTDGTAYDAAAVKANWDAHADPARASLRRAAATGLVCEVTGPLELKVTLPRPNMSFDRTVVQALNFVASPTAFHADPAGFSGKPVGAGPFVLKEWVRGDHQTMVRNPNYWRSGRPYLDEITFKVISGNDQIVDSIAGGQAGLTVMTGIDSALKGRDKGLKVDVTPLDGGQFFAFNMTRRPFDDPRARRAVAMAVDADDLNKTQFGGNQHAAPGMFRAGSALVEPGVAQQPGYDPAEAQRLFDELAGEGRRVDFTYLSQQNPASRKMAEYIQSRLNRYRNVHMEIEALEIGAWITRAIVKRDYQAMNYGAWQPDPDPMYDSLLRTGSASNPMGYANPAADRALDAARAATTPDGRRAAYTDLARVLARDLPVWVFQDAAVAAVYRPGLTNVTLSADGVIMFDRLAYAG